MTEVLDRKAATYARRALDMRQGYGMKWSRRESAEFVRRLVHCSSVEGVDDKDLRVLVRMFHRELIGRQG